MAEIPEINWRFNNEDFNRYEEIMLLSEEVRFAEITSLKDKSKLFTLIFRVDGKDEKLVFQLEECKVPFEKERELLIKEHEELQVLGRHWDDLRWNVSKWFLGIQTVFLAGAAKGLIMLQADTGVNLDLPIALWALSGCSMVLCVMWAIRNLGIHNWHRMAIRRQLMIELDPRIKLENAFRILSSIPVPIAAKHKGAIERKHSSGQMESWGPPLVFYVLWEIVALLTAFPSLRELGGFWYLIVVGILLFVFYTFISIFKLVTRGYSDLPKIVQK
ncbi:MAG: hypothetical protein PHD29_06435 [bacterium]|nr:hypothetical protein [bacterium]